MHSQTPYCQFLTSLLYLQLDRPLGCWGCHCSLTHQNKYWLGTLCSRAGGRCCSQLWLQKLGWTTPPTTNISFIFIPVLFPWGTTTSFQPYRYPSFPRGLGNFRGWTICHCWSHCEVFSLGFRLPSCSGQSLQFLQRWGAGFWGFFLLLILANYGTE